MLVKDQIPAFPELISIRSIVSYVAHGADDDQNVQRKYYSDPEREYVEELAFAKILNLLNGGLIRATGRLSETKKGKATRWQAQQYKQHSKVRSYIDQAFWKNYACPRTHLTGLLFAARNETREYTDIMVVLEDCVAHLAEDFAAHQKSTDSPPAAEYSTPYIDLMWRAVDEFKISRENQPIKETLVEWFMTQEIEGQKVLRATAEYLASFVRLPSSRSGGNRPWKVREQQHNERRDD
jgi:hypothetical protein